jgi:hypothetical protein
MVSDVTKNVVRCKVILYRQNKPFKNSCKETIMKGSWKAAVATLVFIAVPVLAQPADEPLIKLLNEMSDTPGHHLAIAVYYRTLAAEQLTEAEKHRSMGATYRHDHQRFKSGASARLSMTRHCDRLIELHQEVAAEYEELAKLHETEAASE